MFNDTLIHILKSLVKFKEFVVVKDVLEKPFVNSDLLAKVEKIIKKK